MNKLAEKYRREVEEILAKYPGDQKRAATMALLYLAQRDQMYVSKQSMEEIAEIVGTSPTDVGSLVGFYTLYYDQPEGRYRIQVCTDLPCALRGSEKFLAKLCETLGIEPGETTADGLVTVEAVKCLAACHRAPMFQVQSGEEITYHENQTVESALEVIEQLRKRGEQAAAAPGRDGHE